jgi:hypothetical protein
MRAYFELLKMLFRNATVRKRAAIAGCLTAVLTALFADAAVATEVPGELVRWKKSEGGNGHLYQ